MTERYFDINGISNPSELFGMFDTNLRLIEKELDVQLITREGIIKVLGDDLNTQKAIYVFENLKGILEKGEGLSEQDVRYAITMAEDGIIFSAKELGENYVCITSKGKPIKAKTLGQKTYVDAIKSNTVTFEIATG